MAAELLYNKRISELLPSEQNDINCKMELDGVRMWTDVIQHDRYLMLQKKRRRRRFQQFERHRNRQSQEMQQPVDPKPGLNCDDQSSLDKTGRCLN